MHFYLPKPLHGWREFAGEVGIIVVGVLIALGAQEVVEEMHWRDQVAGARASLDTQLLDAKYASLERIAASDCVKRRLDLLDAIIAGERPAEHLKVHVIGLRPWGTAAWNAAMSSGAVAHMTPEVRNRYASLFDGISGLGELHYQAYQTATDVRTLDRHTGLTDVSRDRLAQNVARVRALNEMLTLGARQWLDDAEPLNLKLSAKDLADLQKAKSCTMPDGSGDPAKLGS